MKRSVKINRSIGEMYVHLIITAGNRSSTFVMTEDEAQVLSNRLQAFAKGHFGYEKVLEYGGLEENNQ